jgi:hypothetical protein
MDRLIELVFILELNVTFVLSLSKDEAIKVELRL